MKNRVNNATMFLATISQLKKIGIIIFAVSVLTACVHSGTVQSITTNNAIYEVAIQPGVTRDDILTSLKSNAQNLNMVSPASFLLNDHLKERGEAIPGYLEVHSYCSLGMGAEIFREYPQFSVYAPCRIALYTRNGKDYLGMARPTVDLEKIPNVSPHAKTIMHKMEDMLIEIMNKAAKGEI